jgi:ribokinase
MRVLTIGSAMVDTIAIIDSSRIERMTMLNADSSFLLLEEGRKTEAVEVSTHTGGGAVNVAVAMARLGMDVALLAKLGVDARAETILQRLEKEGVSAVWVKRDPRLPTGSSFSSPRMIATRRSLHFAAPTRFWRLLIFAMKRSTSTCFTSPI